MLAEAEQLGFHTLRGAAHEEEGRTPYAPLIEALDPLAARRPELAARSPTAHRPRCSRLLPSVRRPAGAAEEAVDRHRVFSAVAQLLAQAAAERGVALAIDDLHAADEATAALVHHLARSAVGERLLVVAGMRDEPLPQAAALVRSSLLERGAAVEARARSARPRRRWRRSRRRAAARPLPPGALAVIERSAAGNPFFAEELAASVDASGEITVPPRLRAVVARRLERLEPFGERLLAALAVIDDGFTGAELTALAGAERVDEALGEAEAAGVLESVRGRYRFRHALVREELAARLPEEALRGAACRCRRAARGRRRPARAGRAPPAARRPRARGRPAAHPGGRVGRRRGRLPRRRRVGRARARARGRSRARPRLLALRAQLLHGAGEARAPAAYARGDRGRARGARARRCARNRRARASRRAISPGAKAALEGVQARAARGPGELIAAARHRRLAHGRLGERAPAGRRGRPARSRPRRAGQPEGDGGPRRRRLGAALTAPAHAGLGLAPSSRAASSTPTSA